jgi:hypothetical protein
VISVITRRYSTSCAPDVPHALEENEETTMKQRGGPTDQGSCKVVRQAVDLRGCSCAGAAIRARIRAAVSTDRPLGRSDLGRGRVLTMQVEGTAVAQEARLTPLTAITAGQAEQSDFARALGHQPAPRTPL